MTDKVQSIAYFDYKRPPPTIRDDDPNLDKYDRDFDIAVTCWEYGGKKIKDVTKLYIYGNGFMEGSTRRRVFENKIRRATKGGRIPADAAAVLTEIREELRTFITETSLQKQSRLDNEYNSLAQGGLSFADFRAL